MKNEKNSIDHFFRESLGDHQITPSEKAKEAFLKEASGLSRKEPILKRILPYLILVMLISTGALLVWYFTGGSEREKPAMQSHQSANESRPSGITGRESTGRNHGVADSSPEPVVIHTVSTHEISEPNAGISKENKSAVPNLEIKSNTKTNSIKDQEKSTPITIVREDQDKQTNSAGYPVPGQTEIPVPAIDEQTVPKTENAIPLTTEVPFAGQDSIEGKKERRKDTLSYDPGIHPAEGKKKPVTKEWYLSMAAQYTPEYMFNTLENGKFIGNFGIEGIFVFGNYSVRTGIGFSIGKGTNELAVEYNDYLGSYLRLDSMTFTWDGGIHNYLPSYYLSNQDVWDSLMMIDSLKVVKRYTYLQIPLILGYDIFHTERFSVGFRAGPLLSILVNTKKLSAEYDPGKKRIIKVNSITPEQIDLNWQFMIGINTAVNISRRFRVELEPMAKYYFNSVYEKPDISKKPWSIGIRAALLIKL